MGTAVEPLAPEGPNSWEKLPERLVGAGPPHFGTDPAFRVDLNAPYGLLPDNPLLTEVFHWGSSPNNC